MGAEHANERLRFSGPLPSQNTLNCDVPSCKASIEVSIHSTKYRSFWDGRLIVCIVCQGGQSAELRLQGDK